MSEWRDIESAPRDGTLVLFRNADHHSFGVMPAIRYIEWKFDETTLQMVAVDRGAWLFAVDNHHEGRETKGAYMPFALAMDKYNKEVRYEWKPIN